MLEVPGVQLQAADQGVHVALISLAADIIGRNWKYEEGSGKHDSEKRYSDQTGKCYRTEGGRTVRKASRSNGSRQFGCMKFGRIELHADSNPKLL